MENAEELLHVLEEFSERKPKTIPQELNDYLTYVARTGDPVYQWPIVKCLFKEKLMNVITDFHETTPGVDIPPYPNVDPFNYDVMKNSLLERLDSFTSAPFTVQRLCELLTTPRKQYNRIDKFMRAIEKNILVVSTTEPGSQRHIEQENGDAMEPIVNGSDNNSDYNVDVEMEDMSWKESGDQQQRLEPQPSSSDAHINVDDIEARLQAKEHTTSEVKNKTTTQYESVTPPEHNVNADEQMESKPSESSIEPATTDPEETKPKDEISQKVSKSDTEMKPDPSAKTSSSKPTLVIPEIKVDDAEMTEQKLSQQAGPKKQTEAAEELQETSAPIETKEHSESKEDEIKNVIENPSEIFQHESSNIKTISEVSTSSEESSSSDNTDGNSNSPKTDSEIHIDTLEESTEIAKSVPSEEPNSELDIKNSEPLVEASKTATIKSEDYSISDVKSEIQVPSDTPAPKPEETAIEHIKPVETKEEIVEKEVDQVVVECKKDNVETLETKSE